MSKDLWKAVGAAALFVGSAVAAILLSKEEETQGVDQFGNKILWFQSKEERDYFIDNYRKSIIIVSTSYDKSKNVNKFKLVYRRK